MVKIISSFIFMIILILSGCDSSTDGQVLLERYAFQIQKISGTEIQDFKSALIPYPSKRAISLPLEEIRVNFFDFFSLDQCNVQELIAEKNNAMGRVMPQSRLMVWEQQFLYRLKKCRSRTAHTDDADTRFLAELDSLIARKEKNFPRIYWNATFASPEFRKLFSLAGGSLPASAQTTDYPQVYQALTYLAAVNPLKPEVNEPLDIKVLENQLYHIQRERTAGNVLHSIEQLSLYLEQVSGLLNTILRNSESSRSHKNHHALRNIFHKNYRTEVQPYLSTVYRTGQQMLESIDSLYEQQGVDIPEPFLEYYQRQLSRTSVSGLWGRFEAAIGQHNSIWQTILEADLTATSSGF